MWLGWRQRPLEGSLLRASTDKEGTLSMKRKIKGNIIKKMPILVIIVLGVVAFRYFDLGQYLTLDYIKASQENFQSLYQAHRALVIAAYMGIYIMVTALSLPGAAVLTLAGGGLFGLGVGTLVVSFASTIGATLACLVSRFLLREWVQNKFGDRLKTINEGIEREGAFICSRSAWCPSFHFLSSICSWGLTRMRLVTFFWVSQIGMLAGTLVYVNAGKELAKIDSLSGILSPGLLISFAVLGLFPISVKKLLAIYKRKFKVAPESTGAENTKQRTPLKNETPVG
jgi:uncharacterized membrane protein YdjX (TVP38/TMEM64 family)